MAVKDAHGGKAWNEWDSAIALREPEALEHWTKKLSNAIGCWKFWQFVFFTQWMDLKQYCRARGIQIMEGYGTDAYLHLKRLATTEEALPRRLH